jgi:ribosomal protein L3
MTRVLQDSGPVVPSPSSRSALRRDAGRSREKDGYARCRSATATEAPQLHDPRIGHDAKAGPSPSGTTGSSRSRPRTRDFEPGKALTVKDLDGQMYVDVIGTSKGKGFRA